jgi:threonine dehydrogenase-like Zn-dependent dehydrogenase
VKAVVWHGNCEVRVDDVPDPSLQEPTDAIIRVTSSAICGSDLHLYAKLWPLMREGDILGHESMGIVEEVGPAATPPSLPAIGSWCRSTSAAASAGSANASSTLNASEHGQTD